MTRTSWVVVALWLVWAVVACGTRPSPFTPTATATVLSGSRLVVVTFRGATVPAYPLHIEERTQTRDVVTSAAGAVAIAGPCETGVMVSSVARTPGWMRPVNVQPCGDRFEVALQAMGVTVDPLR